MWVEGGDIHDELLDQLGAVLAPPEDLALTPSAEELQALAQAVAARWPEAAGAPSLTAVAGEAEDGVEGEARQARFGPRTRRFGSSAWRAGSVAAGLVLFSASAAAANGGVPLPKPVRVVAYSVGLPVDSPALHETHEDIKQLQAAVKAKDKPKAEAKARELLHKDLPKVPADEQKVAKPKVEKAIEHAVISGVIEPPALPTTTTTMPTPSTTTAPEPPSTATTEDGDSKGKGKDKSKDKKDDKGKRSEKNEGKSTVTTTAPPTTSTTAPESTTETTVPPADEPTDPEPGDQPGDDGTGEPGTTPTTAPAEPTTTTTTGPPPDDSTTTTTTTAPEPTTTTTTTTAPPAAP